MLPFWQGDTVTGESLFFIQQQGHSAATASLYYLPDHLLAVTNSSGEISYEAGKDYIWKAGEHTLELTEDSRIPYLTHADMYPPAGSPQSIGQAVGGNSNLFWSEGHLFHDLQVQVSYTHADRWRGETPAYAGEALPATLAKLRRMAPLRLVVLGDSISQGYNASGFVGALPGQSAYPGLLADGLHANYDSPIDLINMAVAGQGTAWGITMAAQVAEKQPDLVIIAFGMNDASGHLPPEQYRDNIARIMTVIREQCPAAELILVATMTGNPAWTFAWPAGYPLYRDVLRQLCGPGAALADVTSVWQELLKVKSFADLTGNGVNHPNDFGHRLYAQVILQLLAIK